MKSVATVLVQNLKAFGISHVFGIPGKAISPLVLETERHEVRYVLCRHEAGAGFAAAGFSLGSENLGVALGTSGPGGTNMLTAAAQAKADHLPVLFITGHPSMKNTGRALGQDSSLFGTDLVKLFEPVTLMSARVERGALFQLYFQHALETAFGIVKGPVHLGIPADVLTEQVQEFELELPSCCVAISPEINRILPLLESAQSPVLMLGKGVHTASAYGVVRELAEKRQIPVMTTPGGKGSFPTDHPLSLGVFGLGAGTNAYNYLRSGTDLMLMIGTKLSDTALNDFSPPLYPEQIIQFDCDMAYGGNSPVPAIVVNGDLQQNLQRLLERLPTCSGKAFSVNVSLAAAATETASFTEYISGAQTMRVLRKKLPGDAVVLSDEGHHSLDAINYFDIYQSGTFLYDDDFGAKGHAIGMAIGYQLAQPARKVVCFTGNSCLMMHGTEISTAVCNQLPVIYIVLRHGKINRIQNEGGGLFETPLDAAEFGRSLGATAFRCRSEAEIESALDFALGNSDPSVVEILIDPK